jgi:small subunit ribosomal protein S7
MSRRDNQRAERVSADAKYESLKLAKFINYIMVDGKKSVAEAIVYGALEDVAEEQRKEPLQIFEEVIENLTPEVEVKSKRIGGSTYQVPIMVEGKRALALAFKWLKSCAAARHERTMRERLAAEIKEVLLFRGAAMKKREDTHRMAEANKAFAHYA